MENSKTASDKNEKWVCIAWRGLLGIAVAGVLFSILNYHIPFGGEKNIRYTFDGPSGMISFVYPVSRVRDRERAQDGAPFIRMVEDPVYFDVTTSVPFDTATLDVTYENTSPIPLQMGAKQKEGDTPSILLKQFEQISRTGNWSNGTVSFDLRTSNRYNGKYTFVFSVPGLVTEKNVPGEVRLSEMTLRLKRKSLSWNDIAAIGR
ncbi:MAG: hypothetical protein Q8P56_03860 [Candidatus Uhrbacteria bacterium]|nr:hypothetical protein [Candidatus Uhrbacteria bacterium]